MEQNNNQFYTANKNVANNSFSSNLFDFNFTKWTIPFLIKIAYKVCFLAVLLFLIISIYFAIHDYSIEGAMFLMVFYIVIGLSILIFTKIFLEGQLAQVRAAQNSKIIAEQMINLNKNLEKIEQDKDSGREV